MPRSRYPDVQLLDELLDSFRRAMIGWALLTSAAGLAFFLEPPPAGDDQPSVREALPGPLDEAWSVVYTLGGVFAAVGCQRDQPVFERPGLVMLLGAMGLNLAAIAVTRGFLVALTQALMFSVAFWVFGLRLRYLERERKAQLAAQRLIDLERRHGCGPDA